MNEHSMNSTSDKNDKNDEEKNKYVIFIVSLQQLAIVQL